MNRRHVVTLICLVVICCGRRDHESPAVGTITPASPRPAPLTGATATLGSKPIVTTSGSPPPQGDIHRHFEEVTIEKGHIRVRQAVPRGNIVFRLTNQGEADAELTIEDDAGNIIAKAEIGAHRSAILQMTLHGARYVIDVSAGGRHLRAAFTAYSAR